MRTLKRASAARNEPAVVRVVEQARIREGGLEEPL